jgi:hypothetical protein
MNREEYEQYRATPHWAQVVETTTRLAGGKCRRCPADGDDCHHVHYRTLWHETPGVDVILLCRKCHEAAHGRSGGETSEAGLCRDCGQNEAMVIDYPSGHRLCMDCLKWRRFTG